MGIQTIGDIVNEISFKRNNNNNVGRRKTQAEIERAAITNVQKFLEAAAEFGGFARYLQGFTGPEVIFECDPTTSSLSDALARDLRRRGFKFVGGTTIYAYLQAVGLINAHEPGCFLYQGQLK